MANEAVEKELKKTYGNFIVDVDAVFSEKREIVSFGPSIDIILAGGVPTGSWVTISGPPKSAKTSSTLQFCYNAQQLGFEIYWFDIEARLKVLNLESLPGLDYKPPKFNWIRSNKDHAYNAQDFLNIAKGYMESTEKSIFVFDSYAALSHEREMTEGIGTSTRGGGAMLLSQFCRNMAQVVRPRKHIVIGMMHIMDNTSGYGGPIEKGGRSVVYQADCRLQIKKKEDWVEDIGKKKNTLGLITTWHCYTNALGAANNEVKSYFRFGHGIDQAMELIDLGIDLGLIDNGGKGSWYKLTFLPVENKLQGKNGIYEYLLENPTVQTQLFSEIKKMYNLEKCDYAA